MAVGGIPVTVVESGGVPMTPVGLLASQVAADGDQSVQEALDTLDEVADGRVRSVAQSAVAVPHTGDTVETTLAPIVIPGGLLGPNGQVLVEYLISWPSSGNNKTFRVKFGGTLYQSMVVTTGVHLQPHVRVANRGAANSQVGAGTSNTGYISAGSAIVTSAVDTDEDVTILITGQLANAGETITLEGYIVTVFPLD